MLIRAGDEHFAPGSPGLRFIDWIKNGNIRYGWPTVEDLDYHLTTLFFEVRARGFLELRAGEAVPDELRPAQVVLASALLYDDRARAEAIALLADHRAELDRLWCRAATHGVHDDELRSLACRLWEIALAGAERLPGDWIGAENLAATRAFVDALHGSGTGARRSSLRSSWKRIRRGPWRGPPPSSDAGSRLAVRPRWRKGWRDAALTRPTIA